MKRLILFFALATLLLLVPCISIADDASDATHSITITYKDVEYTTDYGMDVAYGDTFTIRVTPIEDLVYVTAYDRVQAEDWYDGDNIVSVATSNFENLIYHVPLHEYGMETALKLQATWIDEDGEETTAVSTYFLNYNGGTQYIDVTANVFYHNDEEIPLPSTRTYDFKVGETIHITAYSDNELSIGNSTDVEWMTSYDMIPNDKGMAFMEYCWDYGDVIPSEDPTELDITIPNFEIGSEHTLVFCAVGASDNWNIDENTHLEAETPWYEITIRIVD